MRCFFSILIFFCCGNVFAQALNTSDDTTFVMLRRLVLSRRDTILYTSTRVINTHETVDSSIVILYDDTLTEIKKYFDKVPQSYIAYFSNGNKKQIDLYKNGVGVLSTQYYKSGELESQTFWPDSVIEYKSWYKSGQLKWIHKRDSLSKRGIDKHWYESGKLKSEQELSNKLVIDGFSREWCENGVMIKNELVMRGKQTTIRYHCSGAKKEELSYIGHPVFQVGKHVSWYENGKKMSESYYQDTDNPSEVLQRTGVWSFWNEEGKLIRKEYYKNNKLINTKYFIKEAGDKKKIKNLKGGKDSSDL